MMISKILLCFVLAVGDLAAAVAQPDCGTGACTAALRADSEAFSEGTSLLQSSHFTSEASSLLQVSRSASTPPATPQAGAISVSDLAAEKCLPIVLLLLVFAFLGVSKSSTWLRESFASYVAEFVGTFVLVFTVACCINVGTATWNATAIACVLMSMIYATAYVSGGNLNPAVSFALALTGNLDWIEMIKYWIVQTAGGASAAGCASVLFGRALSLQPAAPFGPFHAFSAELLYTFMLCFVVLNCAASKKNNNPEDSNQFFALAIGFVIVAGGYAVGGVSGACFNPAVAFAIDMKNVGLGYGPLYYLAELVGAAVAALLFKVVRPEEGVDQLPAATRLSTKLVSEFLGTFMLVATVGLNVVAGSPATAFSAAASLMCMVYSLGDVSGAHFNPAVTVACVARGACSMGDAVAYFSAQTIGGLSAGAFVAVYHAAGPNSATTYALQPGTGFSMGSMAFAEFFFTFVLAYVVLSVATTSKPDGRRTEQSFYFALAIGSCVTAGGVAVGAVSGGELNPAVSAGIVMLSALTPGSSPLPSVTFFFAAVAAELLGGLAAAMLFRFTHPKEFSPSAPDNAAKLICEFAGTFVLVFTVLIGSGAWHPTAIACALMAMIYAVGPVSGGNLNPSVSFSLGLAGAMGWADVLKYWVAQLAGGAAAAGAHSMLFSTQVAVLEPVAPFTPIHALLVETIYTCMLCFVVLNCAVSKRNNPPTDGNQSFGLAIGFVIIAGGYAVGGISGACFNPAVALGVDIKRFGLGWGAAWALAEFVGAAAAAGLYTVVRPDEKMTGEEFASYVPSLLSKAVSEFLGAFMLVLTVGLNVVMGSPAVAWSAAAALMCMVYALGSVSGAHFNPAVTLAVFSSERNLCSVREAATFVAVQLSAGAVAGAVAKAFHAAGPNAAKAFDLAPAAGYTELQAGLCEFFFTFVLAYVVLAVATVKAPPSVRTEHSFQFALAIGSCVTAGGFAVGAVSGGELNPAVALGIASQAGSIGSWPALAAWELGGGLLAAVTFRLTHPAEFVPGVLKA